MAVPDKVEAVRKVTETLSKQNPAEEMERLAPNKEHFDTLMSSTQSVKPTSFERLDTKAFGTEEVQSIESKPVFAEENVSTQKSGTATDQEQKRRQQQQTEEVDGVSATRSKGSSSSKVTSLMDEVSKLNKNVSNISNTGSPEAIKAQAKDVIAQIDNVKAQLSQSKTEIKPAYQTLLRNRLTHIDDSLKIALNKAGVEYTPPPAASGGNTNAIHKFLGFLTNSQHQLENLNVAIDQFNVTGQITPANMLAIQMKMGYVQQQIELFTSLLNKALESTKTIMNVQV